METAANENSELVLNPLLHLQTMQLIVAVANIVGFVAAAVSMPMGGCRARRPVVDDNSLVTAEPAVL